MLKEIYDSQKEKIDNIIKNKIKKVENKFYKIDYNKNKELIENIDENYNIKLSAIVEELYIKGLKDGINLILECRDEK